MVAGIGAAEHAADGAVEQGDAIVGQAGDRVEHGCDQGGAAAQRRQCPQMLGSETGALARELAQALGMHAFGADLLGNEAQRRGRDRFARSQPSSRIARGAELKSKAEPVVVTPGRSISSRSVGLSVPCWISTGSVAGKASNSSSCSSVRTRRLRIADCPRCRPKQDQRTAAGQARGVQLEQRAALYCRVSTADQSCTRQERDLAAFAARAGYEVIGVFKETGSGKARSCRAEVGDGLGPATRNRCGCW